MKTLRLLIALCVFPSIAAFAADDVLPVYRGILKVGKDRQFVLTTQAGDATNWVKVGGVFNGWTIKAYQETNDSLVLSKGGKEVTLKLEESVLGTDESTQKVTLAQANEVLSRMNFDRMLAKQLEMSRKTQMDMFKKMFGQMKGVDAGEMATFQGKIMDVMMAEITPESMHDGVAQAYADTFSSSELNGLADFYSSPIGQAYADKQPELQNKMSQLMIPKIMAVMPKVQQMAAEFGKQQAAKAAAAQTRAQDSSSAAAAQAAGQ